MSEDELARLETLARAAPSGPWAYIGDTAVGVVADCDCPATEVEVLTEHAGIGYYEMVADRPHESHDIVPCQIGDDGPMDPDRYQRVYQFIAAANPQAVLALLAEVRRLRDTLESLRRLTYPVDLGAENAALRAEAENWKKEAACRCASAPLPRNGTAVQGTLADFATTAEGLAEAWCFYLSRQKLGSPKDLPLDMARAFAELLRQGHDGRKLLGAIEEPRRNRGEYFWQFEARLTGDGKGPPPKPAETPEQRAARVLAQRQAQEQSRQCAEPEARAVLQARLRPEGERP